MSCNGDCGNCSNDNFQNMNVELVAIDERIEPTTLVINLTDECTHRCKYCFVDFEQKNMSYQTAKRCVDFVIENSKKMMEVIGEKRQPSIAFFGGEPLLQFNSIIRPLIEAYQDTVSWSITTNGLLLSPEIIDFFVKYDVNVLCSIDGDRQTQDLNRRLKNGESSFEITRQNITLWKMKSGYLVVRPTLTHSNMNYVYENYLFFKKIGATDVFFGINQSEIWDENDEKILIEQFSKIAKDIIGDLLNLRFPVIKVQNLISSYNRIKDYTLYGGQKLINCKRCGLGVYSCAANTLGQLVGCQERSSYYTEEEVIGDIWMGIDKEKRKKNIENFVKNMSCLKCDKDCPEIIRKECTHTFCLQQLKENKYQIPSGQCIYHRVLMTVAGKMFDIFVNHPHPYIRNEYFQEVSL